MAGIDRLIINSAYREPEAHWKYDLTTETFHKEPGRRPAGYIIAGQGRNAYNDQGEFVELPLVNLIRPRVKSWREAGYPGVTRVTRALLDHWHDRETRAYPFFFCQLDAMETLIWLAEAPEADKAGIVEDARTFARYMADGKKQPYAEWVRQWLTEDAMVGAKD